MRIENRMLKNSLTLNEKTEFIMIDVFKLICALLVVCIHFNPLNDINSDLNFWLTQILARIAVPFFFITSGFFGYLAMQEKTKFIKYIKRIIKLYLLYTIVYLPRIIYGWYVLEDFSMKTIVRFIGAFFITSSYFHLWYFVALIVASCIVYFLINKVKDKYIVVIASVLYVVGVLGNAYKNLFVDLPIIGQIISLYTEFFSSTKNGLFFGFLFVALGYMIRKYSYKIRNNTKIYAILVGLAFIIMNFEEYFAKYLTNHDSQDMIFTTPIVAVLLFLTLSFIKVEKVYLDKGIFCRKLSVLIFGFHMFVSFYFNIINTNVLNWDLNSLEYYSVVVLFTVALAVVIINLQKKKRFDLLKLLY